MVRFTAGRLPEITRAHCMADYPVYRRVFASVVAAIAAAHLLTGCAGSGSTNERPATETNLAVLSRLSAAIADSLAGHVGRSGSQRILLTVEPQTHWFVFDAFERALRARGATVVAGAGEGRIDVHVVEAATAYENSRRGWVFGPSEVDRRIRVHLRIRTESADSLRPVVTGSAIREMRDTLAASDVAALETDGVAATHAPLPEGGWIDDFMEPIIVAGAVAVAVVLLFTVRS